MRKRKNIELRSVNVVAPEALNLSASATGAARERWLERVEFYIRSMDSLGRVVMVHFDYEESYFYLSSVEEVL